MNNNYQHNKDVSILEVFVLCFSFNNKYTSFLETKWLQH